MFLTNVFLAWHSRCQLLPPDLQVDWWRADRARKRCDNHACRKQNRSFRQKVWSSSGLCLLVCLSFLLLLFSGLSFCPCLLPLCTVLSFLPLFGIFFPFVGLWWKSAFWHWLSVLLHLWPSTTKWVVTSQAYFRSSKEFDAGVWKCRFWGFGCNCIRNHSSLVCNMEHLKQVFSKVPNVVQPYSKTWSSATSRLIWKWFSPLSKA